MTTPAQALFLASLLALGSASCVKAEKVPFNPDKCNCNGVRCLSSTVSRMEL
ncbi:MAG: hypothetical protein HY901_04220, partial [Deltaproteobacteria bacterium]|nr:hypothetical protein [Deltaproteobacteria bacterium]